MPSLPSLGSRMSLWSPSRTHRIPSHDEDVCIKLHWVCSSSFVSHAFYKKTKQKKSHFLSSFCLWSFFSNSIHPSIPSQQSVSYKELPQSSQIYNRHGCFPVHKKKLPFCVNQPHGVVDKCIFFFNNLAAVEMTSLMSHSFTKLRAAGRWSHVPCSRPLGHALWTSGQ